MLFNSHEFFVNTSVPLHVDMNECCVDLLRVKDEVTNCDVEVFFTGN